MRTSLRVAALDEKGQYWEGPFDYEQYDESTGEWVGEDGYHMTGTRVGVVPYEP